MQVSIQWLKKFVDIRETPEEIAELLSMLGLEAEVELDLTGIQNCVTATVLSSEKHPNADKLKLCSVTDGDETFNLVCGAPNVSAGQTVVLAKIGAKLPGGFKIKKAKIRGEVSYGMLCSERELGISESADGIMVLDNETPIGVEISEILNESLSSLEIDVTPNRPDALNHLGVAREIAIKTGRELRIPDVNKSSPINISDSVSVKIEDPAGCPRYMAGVVKNVTVKPSPKWMEDALTATGMRPINNLVDISNYILLEMGHPTHIFDFDKFPAKEVVIRRANAGEEFVTLDEEKRKLNSEHLLITNGESPVALAGIMGGMDSAVDDTTKTVLIESAYFDPITIRKGSKALGLLTESSRRFERGADPNGAETAFWRIVELLKELAGGELCSDIVDEYPGKKDQPVIRLRQCKLNSIAGYENSEEFIEKNLTALNVTIQKVAEGEWDCVPPSFRPDLEREIDLIEEFIRIYGYDEVASSRRYNSLFSLEIPDPQSKLLNIYNTLVGLGFRQCYNNSLQPKKVAESMDISAVAVVNPLNEQMSVLRTSLIPGLLHTIDFNIKNGTKDLRLFETGQVHHRETVGFDGLKETQLLSGVLHGLASAASVHGDKDCHESVYTLKGILSALFTTRFKLTKKEVSGYSNGFAVELNGKPVGVAGQISASYIEKLNLDMKEVFAFEVDLNQLKHNGVVFTPLSIYPVIGRDLNFVLDDSLNSGDIESVILSCGKGLIKNIVPTNIFRHESIGDGKKSVVYHLTFQSDNRTLEDKEITPIIEEIISVASSQFGAKLRS
ncbi:MAG: phenylalanine--tRNA ligase subunit beta [Candidatus Marinimicrobia bacterium]|nr:phenylalanine--tRNA ligase subunit beta [Candidatus Neomarinimicrobiota bacterium]